MNLSLNQLTTLPHSIENLSQSLTLLKLGDNPIMPQGNDMQWGRRELRQVFGDDRVVLSDPSIKKMSAHTKKEDVYAALDAQEVRVNRVTLSDATITLPPQAPLNGMQFLRLLHEIWKHLNFTNPKAPGYLSYEVLANDFAQDHDSHDNRTLIYQRIRPRLLGYFKTLYGLPVASNEPKGWQMYEEAKPQLKNALTFILNRMKDTQDPDQRAAIMTQLVNGLLHCPTGQAEGVETVAFSLLHGQVEGSKTLPSLMKKIFSIHKMEAFKQAILSKAWANTQNVHLIRHYQEALEKELGLGSALKGFKDHIGTMGDDPFNGNPANALLVYYQVVTPARLVQWILEAMPTSEMLTLIKKINQAEASEKRSPTSLNKERLEEELQGLNTRLASPERFPPHALALFERRRHAILQELETLSHRQAKGKERLSREDELEEEMEGEESPSDVTMLKEKLKNLRQFHPLTIDRVLNYLKNLPKDQRPDFESDTWWQDYFTRNPLEDIEALLTPKAQSAY